MERIVGASSTSLETFGSGHQPRRLFMVVLPKFHLTRKTGLLREEDPMRATPPIARYLFPRPTAIGMNQRLNSRISGSVWCAPDSDRSPCIESQIFGRFRGSTI